MEKKNGKDMDAAPATSNSVDQRYNNPAHYQKNPEPVVEPVVEEVVVESEVRKINEANLNLLGGLKFLLQKSYVVAYVISIALSYIASTAFIQNDEIVFSISGVLLVCIAILCFSVARTLQKDGTKITL